MTSPHRPQLWFIAGPNGAGKSTLAERFSMEKRLTLVNPDNIAREMNPGHPESAGIQAGREALKQQNRLLAEKKSFVIESTMSGKRELELLRQAKEAGYKVNLVYCGVESPHRSLFRVETRVAAGGHHVPAADVLRRYGRSMLNLPEALKIVDRALIFDKLQGATPIGRNGGGWRHPDSGKEASRMAGKGVPGAGAASLEMRRHDPLREVHG